MEISVCIPLYNAEKFIAKTIESVLAQTRRDFELLVIDDGSTDSSVEIVESYKDARIRLLKNETNLGMHGSMDRCIREAKGKYVLILCNDDLITSDCLQEKAAILENYQNVNLVFSASEIINEKGNVIMKRSPFKKTQCFEGKQLAKKSFETKNIFAEPSNVMMRREAALQVGGFDKRIKYSIDWEYWLRICSTGDAFYINKSLSQFRISEQSMTSQLVKRRKEILNEDIYFSRKYKENNIFGFKETTFLKHFLSVRVRQYAKELFFKLRRIKK